MTDDEMKKFEKFLIEHKEDIDLMCSGRKIDLDKDESIFEEINENNKRSNRKHSK